MAFVHLSQRWRRQPAGFQGIDLNNPLAPIRAYNLAFPLVEVVEGVAITVTSSGVVLPAFSQWGRGLAFGASGSSNRLNVGSGAYLGALTNWTMVAIFSTVSAGVSGGRAIYVERPQDTGVNICKFAQTDGDANMRYTYRNDASSLLNNSGSNTINDGAMHVVVFTRDASNFTAWVDGKSDLSAAAITPNFTDSGMLRQIGQDPFAANASMGGVLNAVYLYKRTLLQNEALELYKNPWQVFKPQATKMYFNAAAGGLPFPKPQSRPFPFKPGSPRQQGFN